MKATICDRCGMPFETVKRGSRKYTLRTVETEVVRKQMSRGVEVDLCPICYSTLEKWITNNKRDIELSNKLEDAN